MTVRALDGISVLDLSEYVAGAYCGKLLGEFGAEVIKIENPEGDGARREGPFLDNVPRQEASALFAYLNTNKLGITLDCRKTSGQRILRDLVSRADILVENFGPQFQDRLGLSLGVMRAWNPRLITVSVSYFGETGPYARFRGTPLVAYALGGYMYLTGEPDREPLQGPGPQPEYLGGLHGAVGALAALCSREATGVGQHVEVPIFEVMVSLHQFTIVRYNYGGIIQKRLGNRYAWTHPITLYACQDGYVAMSASAEEQAQRLMYMMGMESLLEDPRFADGLHRLANADDFDTLVEPWFRERSKEEVFHLCQEWRIPCGLVTTAADLLRDPQYLAREYWVQVEHLVTGTVTFPGAPFRMSETPCLTGRAPLLGEHNQLILGKRLGYSAPDLVRLRQEGVI